MLGFLSLQGLKNLVISFIWTSSYSSFANTTASAQHSELEIEHTNPAADAGEAENRSTEMTDTSRNDGNQLTEGESFWLALDLTVESAKELFSAFPQVIVETPVLNNPGIRPLSVDEILKVKNPPVIFNIAARPEWNPETRDLATIISSVHISKPQITHSAPPDPEWDRWSSVREDLLTSLMSFYNQQTDHAPNTRPPGDYHPMLYHWEHFHNWNLFSGAFVHLLDEWYSNNGFPFPVAVVRRNYSESGGHVYASGSSSDALFLGRTWTINPKDRALPIHIALFAASQVCLNHDSRLQEWPRECAWMLPLTFSCPWPSSPWIRFCCKGQKLFHAQFHIRYWTVYTATADSLERLPGHSGLRTERAAFEITSYHKKNRVLIREARASVGILTSHSSPKSHFSMVSLVDDPGLSLNVHEDDYWHLFAREQSPATAGFVATQAAVARMIKQWAYEWTKTLESFDVLETPGTDQNRCPAMTDEHEVSLTQEQQQQLFTRRLRQTIVEAKQVILDTSYWFKNLIEDFHYSLEDAATNRVRENWVILSKYYGEKETRLLQYLDDMDQELSIRDSTPSYKGLQPQRLLALAIVVPVIVVPLFCVLGVASYCRLLIRSSLNS